MNARTAQTTDELRLEVAQIDERMTELKARRDAIVAELAKLPVGTYDTAAGGFTVKAPSRRFDADRAYQSLNAEQRLLCLGPIPALVKGQIPPAVLDAFMVATDGPNTVVIR